MKYFRKPFMAALSMVLLSATAGVSFASPSDGVEKGNGTLPTRMGGEMKIACSGETVPVETFIREMIDVSTDIFRKSNCSLRGLDVRKFSVDGYFTQLGYRTSYLKITEVCIDDEANRAEIVVQGSNGKPQRFLGNMTLDDNDVIVELSGSVSTGGSFYLQVVEESDF